MFAVAAVVRNPWVECFIENLKPEIMAYGPKLGKILTNRMIALAENGDRIEAYGKVAIVGLEGEIELEKISKPFFVLFVEKIFSDRPMSKPMKGILDHAQLLTDGWIKSGKMSRPTI